VKSRGKAFFRQLHPIALDAREGDFQRIPLGPDGLDLHRFWRWLWRGDDRLGGEIERNGENVGIFHDKQPLLIKFVDQAAQGAPDHLFAQQLRAEGANAEDMGDGVGGPTLGEHRHRHHAADRTPQLPRLADRIHDLAQ